ncbi:MAG: YfiR family protein [Verrucomicrobia bacterium]|nr:YfiR family protein [Verrucomicrobiota bacterium]
MKKFLSLLLVCLPLVAQTPLQQQMERLVAGFISNFPAYVSWPSRNPMHISMGLIGQDPLGIAGRSYLQERQFKLQILEVDQLNGPNFQQFHMLYFGSVHEDVVKRVLKLVEKQPILTIGTTSDFLEKGGIIQLNVHGKSVTFTVSVPNAQKAGLKIDPRLIDYGRSM